MASKDFIYDLLDKLEEERTEYVLLTLSRGEEESSGDLYFNLYYEDSREDASQILKKLSKVILQIPEEDGEIEIDLDWYDDDDDDENEK